MNSAPSIKITEVGPRDGLQNEKTTIPTSFKIEWIKSLIQAGIQNLEITSFVKKEAIPQLSDAWEVSQALLPLYPQVQFSCLTPNSIGYQKAKDAGFKEVAVFTAVSETFTQKNIRCSVAESLQRFQDIFQKSREDQIQVRGYISTVVACPYEGWIEPEKVLEVTHNLLEQGVYEISLGDTIGKASPDRTERLLELLLKHYPPHLFCGHFHDTYGMALANVVKSLEMGLRSFDASAGGLGGCPYADGASGNLATEDLVYLLEGMGYQTHIRLDKLVETSQKMEAHLGRELTSKVYQAIHQKSKHKRGN